jgi:hypothetical protein
MRTDMSPEAVLGRLNAMGQLWELSVALMDQDNVHNDLRSQRWQALAVQSSIRKVLMDEWDPIGVQGVPEAIDEYDGYIGRFYRILAGNRSKIDLIDCLERIERDEMGVSTSEQTRDSVVNSLLALNVTLNKNL